MHDACRLAYAQARIQARFSARPSAAFWRALSGGRDFEHNVETVRASPLAPAVASVSAATSEHELEALLRRYWAACCQEIARWYPSAWREAFEWLSWLPWLPALTWLASGRAPQPWMSTDPRLEPVAAAEAPERALVVAEGPLAPLADAWREGTPLREAWEAHWRATWRPLPAHHAAGLERLAAVHRALWPQAGAHPGPSMQPLLQASAERASRLFRRHGGTAVAGLAFVTLRWLDTVEVTAGLSVARSFGAVESA